MSRKYPSNWYVQHSRDVVRIVGEQEVSHLKHRTLVLERYRRPELVVVFNERLQYHLATQVRDNEYLLITARKETSHGSQGKSRRILRRPRPISDDEEPA